MLVSVIIPALNEAENIARTIQAARRDYALDEVEIVVAQPPFPPFVTLEGSLSNFDVHNDTKKDVHDLELDLLGITRQTLYNLLNKYNMSAEGYGKKASCLNGIESVRKNSQTEERFEVRTAKDGRTYFVLKATNGQEVGRSQMYKSDSGCRNGMKSVAKNAADSAVVEEEA
mgnify:CR=1 FL=1